MQYLRKLQIRIYLLLNQFYNRHICGEYPYDDKL